MSQITQSLDAFSLPSDSFSIGSSSSPAATVAPAVVRFSNFQTQAPVHAQTIDGLISRWSADPEMAEALKSARQRRAAKHVANGVMTLKTLRMRKGMTQAELAKAVGLQQPHIARIERATSCPTLETCRRLARALNVDMNTLDSIMPRVNDCVETAE